LLFLGAGASTAFGLPTMQQLTLDARAMLESEGFHQNEFDQITDILEKHGYVPDFEALLTILDALASPQRAVRASGPFSAYLLDKLPESVTKEDPAAGNTTKKLKQMLVDKCLQADLDKAGELYNRFFEILAKTTHVHKRNGYLPNMPGVIIDVEGRHRRRIPDIFTVNYDLIIEHFFEKEKISNHLRSGFVRDGMRMVWNPDISEGYDFEERAVFGYRAIVNLVKLHGSIDQFITKGGIEKRQAPPTVGYYPSQPEEEMMIFPVTEKYATRGPYPELFGLFRKQLRTDPVCIIIGYSFRDDAVNNAFADAIKTNSDLKIIYIGGSHAEEHLNNVPEIAKRTKAVNKRFGFDTLDEEILSLLAEWFPN
jgi:hypothetical protein